MTQSTNHHHSTTSLTTFQSSPFDAIRQIDSQGREFWSARTMQDPLGYIRWENFKEAIEKGRIACKNNGYNPNDHFRDVTKIVKAGATTKPIQDFLLSRIGCYFTAMNGDPRKPEIAAAQGYFVTNTMENEAAKPRQQELADLKTMFTTLQHQITESIQLSPVEQGIKDCLIRTGLKLTTGEIKLKCLSLEVKLLPINVMDKLCEDMAYKGIIRKQYPIGNQTASRFFF